MSNTLCRKQVEPLLKCSALTPEIVLNLMGWNCFVFFLPYFPNLFFFFKRHLNYFKYKVNTILKYIQYTQKQKGNRHGPGPEIIVVTKARIRDGERRVQTYLDTLIVSTYWSDPAIREKVVRLHIDTHTHILSCTSS